MHIQYSDLVFNEHMVNYGEGGILLNSKRTANIMSSRSSTPSRSPTPQPPKEKTLVDTIMNLKWILLAFTVILLLNLGYTVKTHHISDMLVLTILVVSAMVLVVYLEHKKTK